MRLCWTQRKLQKIMKWDCRIKTYYKKKTKKHIIYVFYFSYALVTLAWWHTYNIGPQQTSAWWLNMWGFGMWIYLTIHKLLKFTIMLIACLFIYLFIFKDFIVFKKFIYLCIYFWLRWVFIAVCGLSLVAASGGYSSLQCTGFSLWWLFLLQSTGSRRTGFSSCGMQAQ